MKKKVLRILLMLTIVMSLFLALSISASAFDWEGEQFPTNGTYGNIRLTANNPYYVHYSKPFNSESDFNTIIDEFNKMEFQSKDIYDLQINIYQDMSVSDFDIDAVHSSLTLNLNGHTLTVTGNKCHTLENLIINGDGGTIDYKNVEHDDSLFTFDEVVGNHTNSIIHLDNVTIQNVSAERLFDLEDPYSPNDPDSYPGVGLSNVTFRNIKAGSYGGVFYINNPMLHDINFTNVHFGDVESKHSGGAIYVNNIMNSEDDYAKLNMTGCSFENCTSKNDANNGGGGAIYLNNYYVYVGNSSSEYKDKNVCSECKSAGSGGAIYDRQGYNTIQNFRFEKNSCDSSSWGGGAIVLDGYKSSYLNCDFNFNHAQNGYGGAIYLYHSSSGATINNCSFSGNTVPYGHDGPDIYNKPGSMTDNSFESGNPFGFTLSGGNLWIVIAGGVVVLGGIAAIIVVSKKKKKNAA